MNTLTRDVHTEQVRFPSRGADLAATLFLPSDPEGLALGTHSSAELRRGRPATDFYRREKPAMILCHGAGEFKEHYFELCEYLARRGVAALAVDMHGHGASGGDRFHVEMRDWVMDVRAAVDFLSEQEGIDGERIGAFGLSSGGTAILEAALEEPRLKALVLLDATVRNSMPLLNTLVVGLLVWMGRIAKLFTRRDLRVPVLKMFGNLRLVSDADIEARLLEDPRTMEAYLSFPFPGGRESFFVDTLRRIAGVKVPTLVLWGEEDELDPPETAKMIFDKLSCKKQLEIVEGNGHAGHLDRNRAKVFSLTTNWALGNLA